MMSSDDVTDRLARIAYDSGDRASQLADQLTRMRELLDSTEAQVLHQLATKVAFENECMRLRAQLTTAERRIAQLEAQLAERRST